MPIEPGRARKIRLTPWEPGIPFGDMGQGQASHAHSGRVAERRGALSRRALALQPEGRSMIQRILVPLQRLDKK